MHLTLHSSDRFLFLYSYKRKKKIVFVSHFLTEEIQTIAITDRLDGSSTFRLTRTLQSLSNTDPFTYHKSGFNEGRIHSCKETI